MTRWAAPGNVCSQGAAPSTLMLSGQTFRYTSFNNASAPVDAVMVRETFATNYRMQDGSAALTPPRRFASWTCSRCQ